jgi:opacity protein-like surface antigen
MAWFGGYLGGVAVSAIVMAGQALAADSVNISYDVFLGGSRVLKAEYAAQFDDATYAANFSAKTVGMSKMFSKIKLNLAVNGRLSEDGLQPIQYAYYRKKNDKVKERGLQFKSDGSLKTEGAGYDAPLIAVLKKNVTDPLTMLLKISRSDKPCSGKHRSFDGRDVFDISLAQVSADNGRLECTLVYKPVAGADVNDGDTDAVTYGIRLAPTKTTQKYVTVGLTGSNKGVPFSVDATSISVNGAPLTY